MTINTPAPGRAYRRYDFKAAFLDELLAGLGDRDLQVLDLGSGTSKDFVEVLRHFPRVRYTGVEYREASLARARELLRSHPAVTLQSGFGEAIQAGYEDHFDLTLSLSVLEHVKHLDSFLHSSVRVTRRGGWVVHRYDLGHALHSGPYERTKVFLCKNAGWAMPARHFTTHPDLRRVTRVLEAAGLEIRSVTHAQLPDLKQMINRLDWTAEGSADLATAVIDVDRRLARHMETRCEPAMMERLFPAITVAGVKR
jgi:SAM-dependent methyltransferase